jgi:pyrimidine operon attenuation protein/uracil phosphoribosyltransferase
MRGFYPCQQARIFLCLEIDGLNRYGCGYGAHVTNEIERVLLTQDDIRRAMTRISHEILEQNRAANDLVLVGLQTRGVHLAKRIAESIARIEGLAPVVGTLDPRLWRDDPDVASGHPSLPSDIRTSVDGKPVVIVDDVLYTGRTIRAAMEALLEFGRASRIQLAVLVDRGHRELPIRPDFIGKNIPTARGERVQVRIMEIDGNDAVVLGRES